MAQSKSKQITVELDTADPKKRVVKFTTDEEDAAVGSVYVSNVAVKALGGCEDGVKITIEAL